MSSQPFNSLGQILAKGGEIALAQAIWQKQTPGQIAALFARKFDPMTNDDREKLYSLAEDMVASAKAISSADEDAELSSISPPLNESPSWDTSEGDRLHWTGVYRPVGNKTWYATSGTWPIDGTIRSLLEYLRSVGKKNINDSPDSFKLSEGVDTDQIEVQITGIEAS